MINLINILNSIFSKLEDSIAYLDSSEGLIYRQKNRSIRITDVYIKILFNNFIKRSTIEKNKEILNKLMTLQLDNLIAIEILDNGFLFRVYNKLGNLIYMQKILLYDKCNRLLKYILRKKYPELVLDPKNK